MAGYPPPVGFNFDPNAPQVYPPQGPQGPLGYPPQHPMGYPPQGGPLGYLPPPGSQPQEPMGFGHAVPGLGGTVPGYGAPPAMGYGYGPAPGMGAGAGAPGSQSMYYIGRPTVVPQANFDPGQDAEVLRKAMRGLGTDEASIIEVLSKRTSAQRAEIAKKYKASFGKDLQKSLKSELSGKFEELVLMSIETLPSMLATTMHEAMEGAGTEEQILIQALIPYPNAIISQISQAYKTKYGRDLVEDVRKDTSSDFEKILVAMLQAQREENTPVDMGRAAADAEALYKAGEKRVGTEEAVFTRIFSQKSFEQIKAIANCYQQNYGKTLEKAVKKETSGDYEDVLVAIVRYAEDKNTQLAEWFYKSMAGMGTHDKALMQLVLGRCEIDLQDVKDAYQRKYGKSLAKAIENDTSGDYKKMLVALVGP